MPQAYRDLEPSNFDVILYFKNGSWTFSTSAYSSHSKAALEFAEKEFSVHALHHRLGPIKASYACVMDQVHNHYFTKRAGRWRVSTNPASPKLSRTARIRVSGEEERFCGSGV